MQYENVKVNSERWLSLENLLDEEWKDIKDYEGLYQISNYGRVKSLANKSNHKYVLILKISISRYCRISLNKNSKTTSFDIHRLVANAFIPNLNNYPVINHKNGIKTDNRVYNLEWCTQRYKTIHAIKTGLKKANKNEQNNKSMPILQLDLDNNILNYFPSIMEAERKTKIKNANIARACKKHINACGFKWRYVNDVEFNPKGLPTRNI